MTVATTTAALGHSPEQLRRSVQRRTLAVLLSTQTIGGVGVAIGIAVGALLTADMAGVRLSGVAQSAAVVGGALITLPVTRLMRSRGRRAGLALAYVLAAIGAVLTVFGAVRDSLWMVFAGLFLFGAASTANLQARYAAVDLTEPSKRGRQLSLIVWATTVGAIAGPNLAPVADHARARLGVADGWPRYTGPYVLSAAAFLIAAAVIFFLLRPDPLLTARALQASAPGASAPGASAPGASAPGAPAPGAPALGAPAAGSAAGGPVPRVGLRAAISEVAASPAARLGIAAVAMGHVVMVGVMSMTPVHIGENGYPDTLRIVGIVLSIHIAGMYAFAPLMGWLTDRIGRRAVIVVGIALLLSACAVAGSASHDVRQLATGLGLLGLGWSATLVAGSTLLTESVELANRPAVQGLSDLVMGLAGASAGALSGVVVAWSSYATLTMLAAVATVPLIALVLRPITRPISQPG